MRESLMRQLENGEASIAIVGLGYVGLPLAVAFGRKFRTLGFDIDARRIEQLRQGRDATLEVDAEELASADQLSFSDQADALSAASVFVVTVPTPIDSAKRPDLRPLEAASALVGRALSPGDLVIFESTVYPGATEEVCVPILERESGLRYLDGSEHEDDAGFHCGYSPERINPGDRQHRLSDIVKVTSGSSPAAAEAVDALYRQIIRAGTFRAESIRVAEAAKVIENTQRDLNIALVNELAILFSRLGLDTASVLAAAGSKWNFLPFKPGLVGGHCIGVDPYYLTHKAQSVGHHPAVILAGRRVNDAMGQFVASQVLRLMAERAVYAPGARVLVLGLTFKENCPDLRNTRVIDLIRELEAFKLNVDVHDPWADAAQAREEYGIELVDRPSSGQYAAVIHAVAHGQFRQAETLRGYLSSQGVLYDVRATLDRAQVDGRL
ncbi:nucleotide sugar dehydrogenase [Wenzhouxiangella marina]|uniref:Vi polysaccharide biosynthesis protein VipA/TviB n=1 Tax=Wenzhouxiangella marina TaxID=1579979 RepID=A0A0K0XYB0_9GAMM|nr:nucleotide sugar dehydrogenase [Wenzhouxiangella marina]AKS42617.1 Vi polysaccharide biosynthesis protein VipA/TviB [Wenzhouxiangella marina]MBB6085601.1 UDP-N-acetyl-D-galactosamine dehydrogenase [Wenzhouxiangella marina]